MLHGLRQGLGIIKPDVYSAVGTGRGAPPAPATGFIVHRPAAFDPDRPHVAFINAGTTCYTRIVDLDFKAVQPRKDSIEAFLWNVAVIAHATAA